MDKGDLSELTTLGSIALINLLHHADKRTCGLAALELGKRKEAGAVDALITLLQESAWGSTPCAALALAQIGDKRAVEPLIAALSNPLITWGATEALALLHDEKALEPLIRLFESSFHPRLATILGKWGDRRAVEPLIKGMSHPHPLVRFYTARALGKLADKRAIAVLEWARDNDTDPILSVKGRSVSEVAGKAIAKIQAPQEPKSE